jgi:tetratricopeptide (TPR) repeat protein
VVKIYISSTFEDLKEYREAVYRALRKMRHDVIAMEDYVATDQRPIQKCLEDVASCDIYIGIFAWRYGFIPEDKKDNPNGLSITELEYRKAKEKGIPCLTFLLNKEEWPIRFIDGTPQSGTKGDNIMRFRNELKTDQISSFFENKDQLAGLVVTAVHQVFDDSKKTASKDHSQPVAEEKSIIFEDEKERFVGRDNYINIKIKEKIKQPGSRVSIIGPGGSGKTQLAYKAIRQYINENIFDSIVPIYFSRGILSFSSFLSKMAERMKMPIADFEKESDIEKRKQIIKNLLKSKRHPLLYLDNYESVSFELNKHRMDKNHKPSEEALQIEYFLNNIPANTSILLTSRETNNRLAETSIELAGLEREESQELFSILTRPIIIQQEGLANDNIKKNIDKIIKVTGGHPLSLELIVSNIDNIYDIEKMVDEMQIQIGQASIYNPDERLRSLQGSFDYTVNRLNEKLGNLLLNLSIFNSPFPIDAPVKIFLDDKGSDENNYQQDDIVQLYNRSLLTRIQADDLYGKMNLKYWLYFFHPATRNYVDSKKKDLKSKDVDGIVGSYSFGEYLQKEYGEKFSFYYYNLVSDMHNSIGKENHRNSLAQFNLISQGKDNDFERSIIFLQDKKDKEYEQKSADILRYLGLISKYIGLYTKAEEYFKRGIDICSRIGDRIGLAGDYKNIGVLYYDIGDYEQALEYYNKALEIDTDLNDRVGLAGDYKNIGVLYRNIGDYEQALEYYNKALEIDTQLNRRVGLAGDYNNIGNVYRNIGDYEQALEYYNKALEIDTDLNDRVGLAKDNYNMSFPLYRMNKKKETIEHLSIAKTILLDFKKETGYSHPLLKDIEDRMSSLNQDKK